MGSTNHRRLRHVGMCHERTFNFSCPDAVAADVKYIIAPAGNKEIPIMIAVDSIVREIVVSVGTQISLKESLVIPQAGPSHAWPRLPNSKNSFDIVVFNDFTGDRIQDDGIDSIHGEGAASRLHRRYTRDVGTNVAAGLSLPICVHHSALLSPNLLVVPSPSLRIDGLTDGAENAQTGEIVSLGNVVAVSHKRSDRCRSRVEMSNPMAFDHIPVTTSVGIHRGALENERRTSVQ
mmetsp:Transcript_32256/g.94971  ORF Transcript_32256/g.94971 Transcript_32256/m.94971 type:complete len:234 (-) Transcript_32256:1236-1937(-)